MTWQPVATIRKRLARERTAGVARVVVAAALPFAAVASGFTPLNHAADVLSINNRPVLVALVPSVLLAAAATIAALMFPLRPAPRIVRAVGFAAALLVIGGALSTVASPSTSDSVVLLVGGLGAPLVFALALLMSDLPRGVMCWSFLLTTAAFLLRADVVFLLREGLPTPDILFRVKYENAPYDFHYYTLNNPNYSSAFLVIPLTLAAFWAADARLARATRVVLVLLAALMFLNLVLVYVRFTMVLGMALLGLALVATPMRPRLRIAAAAGLVLAATAFLLNPATLAYFSKLGDTSADASQVVRLVSVVEGLRTLVEHPLTGVGLGFFGTLQGLDPAHSSIAQSGAEMGVAGFIGSLLLTVVIVWVAWTTGVRERWHGLPAAAGIAAGVFCLQTAVALGPPTWLASYSNAVWGLSLGIVLAGATARQATERHAAAVDDALVRLRQLRLASAVRARTLLDSPVTMRLRRPPVVLVVYGALAAVLAIVLWWGASDPGEVTAAWQATLRDTFARLGVGADDPTSLLRRLCMVILVIATGAAPWLWWRFWGSWAAALVSAPVMLGFGFVFDFPVSDAVPAVAIFLSLPILATALRRPTAPTLPVALGVSAASAAASLVHPLAGSRSCSGPSEPC